MRETRPLQITPTLTIELIIQDDCRITVWRGGEKDPALPPNVNTALTFAQLASLRETVEIRTRTFAELLRMSVRAKTPAMPVRTSMDALWGLHRLGYFILLQLIGSDDLKFLPFLRDLVRDACTIPLSESQWDNPRWNVDQPRFNLIKINTPVDYGIPFDILPLLNLVPDVPPESENIDDLGQLACSFLGFSAIVKRHIGKSLEVAPILENNLKLPLKLFIHRQSRGMVQEEEDLRNHPYIDADDGWPKDATPPQSVFAGHLAKYLWESDTRFGSKRTIPDQICHFSCHSETALRVPPSEYQIRLHDGSFGGARTADLLSLEIAIGSLAIANTDGVYRPFVFLNSCGSGNIDPGGSSSFPRLFSKYGFSGVIGTETVVPEPFASAFATKFYDHLLTAGTVGKAILLSRWDLLKAPYNNPTGLIYTLFAEPEIGVRQPIPIDPGTPVPVQAEHGIIATILQDVQRVFSG